MAKMDRFNAPRPQVEVYTSHHATSLGYNALPSPATSLYSLVMAGSITGLAYFVGDKWFNGQGGFWSIIAISTMTVIGVIVLGVRMMRAKKRQAAEGQGFETALRGSAAGWDGSVSDPAEIARLDDLRSNFQKGIQTFSEYGKDIYSLPWYVIMGEPGSGKSEAIRRSELRFPDALQDKLQGTGGTYSMHWWFTNHAIIIDTAGAILMQPEAAGRFEEFLKLLRTHRAACPINGMILTIPVDSLLTDSPQLAEQKARTIASQLGVIQKALDVRFPIYLMISKSDRLPGFREFFDAEGQASFERQMMGWSNPDPLGTIFAPERIYEAVDTIAYRLQNRALALLADPVSPNPGNRRMDEVDALYSFPTSLRSLSPRLRLYLDVIFQTGTWATKPPFFRGMYFTSALREGAQLDQQLAQALGMPLNQLPPGGFFAREKAVFLRDLFMEKIFHESGLVTRLFDVGAHLRKRLTTFYGATAALLLLSLGFAWLVRDKIKSELKDDQVLWSTVNGSWNNGTLLATVTRRSAYSDILPDRPGWDWAGNNRAKGERSNLELLQEIRERVHEKVAFAWVFKPIPEWRDFLQRRKEGYLTAFEASVMKPVLDAARERMLWDTAPGATTSPETQILMAKAYGQLLLLETWLDPESKAKPEGKEWRAFFNHLLAYVLDAPPPGGFPTPPEVPWVRGNVPSAADLADLAEEAYGAEAVLSSRGWMSENAISDLPDNESALIAVAGFIFGVTKQKAESNDQQQAEIREAKASAMSRIEGAEQTLLRLSTERPNGPRQVVDSDGLQPLRESLAAYEKIMGDERGMPRSAMSMEIVTSTVQAILEAAKILDGREPAGLHKAAELAMKQKKGGGETNAAKPEGDDAWAATHKRLRLYEESFKAESLTSANIELGNNLVGHLADKLTLAAKKAQELAAAASPAAAGATPEPLPAADAMRDKIAAYLRKFKGTPLISEVFEKYQSNLLSYLSPKLKFPLVQCQANYETIYELEKAGDSLNQVKEDRDRLQELTESVHLCEARETLEKLFGRLEVVFDIKQALLGAGQAEGGGLTIEMDAVEPPKQMSKQQEIADPATLPGAVPTTPKASMTETIAEGFTSLKIVIGSSIKAQGPPTGENKKVSYNGLEPVKITLTFSRPPPATQDTYDYSSTNGKWPLLREMAAGRDKFQINSSPRKGFHILSKPSLPVGQWPRRIDLGLPAEPNR